MSPLIAGTLSAVPFLFGAAQPTPEQTKVSFSMGSFFVSIGLALVLAGVIVARKIEPVGDESDPMFFSLGGRKPTGKLFFAIAVSVAGGILAVIGLLNM